MRPSAKEKMIISILCPRLRCRAILRVPESVRGKQVRCSACGSAFVVPAGAKGASPRPKPQPEPTTEGK